MFDIYINITMKLFTFIKMVHKMDDVIKIYFESTDRGYRLYITGRQCDSTIMQWRWCDSAMTTMRWCDSVMTIVLYSAMAVVPYDFRIVAIASSYCSHSINYRCEDGSGNVLQPLLSEIMVVTLDSNETILMYIKETNIGIVHDPTTTLICIVLYSGNLRNRNWICGKIKLILKFRGHHDINIS